MKFFKCHSQKMKDDKVICLQDKFTDIGPDVFDGFCVEYIILADTTQVIRNYAFSGIGKCCIYLPKAIREIECDGYAIGGLAVGEATEDMYRIIDAVEPHMPKDKPRYLMGVGTPCNILEAIHYGVDFFDCVMPTRNARHGNVFTWHGKMNLTNEKYALDDRPIDSGCECTACKNYSRSYIRHLLKAKETVGMTLAVTHNLYFYNELMEKRGKYKRVSHLLLGHPLFLLKIE